MATYPYGVKPQGAAHVWSKMPVDQFCCGYAYRLWYYKEYVPKFGCDQRVQSFPKPRIHFYAEEFICDKCQQGDAEEEESDS